MRLDVVLVCIGFWSFGPPEEDGAVDVTRAGMELASISWRTGRYRVVGWVVAWVLPGLPVMLGAFRLSFDG